MEVKQLEKDFLTFKAESEIFDINCAIPCFLDETLEDQLPAPETYFGEGINKMVLTSTLFNKIDYETGNNTVFDAAAKDVQESLDELIVEENTSVSLKIRMDVLRNSKESDD
ncbi:MAG: hypothetical protein IJW69_04175, partial [Clostridia bacterium]|nr:hypothetical protein [Clostridia bacterium]